jgi:hypothetical protein
MTNEIKKNIEDAEMYFFMEADSEIIKQHLNDCEIEGESLKRDLLLKRIKFLAKAAANKQRDNSLLVIASKCKEAIEKNIEKPIQFLRDLMASKLSTSYNSNLDKLSQEEIIDLIKDQNLANLLDQLDQDGTDNQTKI